MPPIEGFPSRGDHTTRRPLPLTYTLIGNTLQNVKDTYMKVTVLDIQGKPPSVRSKASPIDHFMESNLTYKQLAEIGGYDLKLPHPNVIYMHPTKPPAVGEGVTHVECYYLKHDGTVVELFTPVTDEENPANSNLFGTHYKELAPDSSKAVFITGVRARPGTFAKTVAYCVQFQDTSISMRG